MGISKSASWDGMGVMRDISCCDRKEEKSDIASWDRMGEERDVAYWDRMGKEQDLAYGHCKG